MNFASLLSKEIDKKRASAAPKRRLDEDINEDINEGVTETEKQVNEKEVNEKDQKEDQQDQKEDQKEDPVQDQDQDRLNDISESKLDETLVQFNEYSEELSKIDKIKKIDIPLRDKERNDRYQKQLDMEKAVDPMIDIQEITDLEQHPKIYLQLRVQIKKLIHDWDSHIQRLVDPDQLQSQQQLLFETKRDLVKLLYKLRSHKLKQDMLISLATIFYYLQQHDYNKANENYMKLSIGNVAWPIGVKSIGIHARSASLKITGENKQMAANIMIDDNTRRWITAIKRLITFASTARAGV
ncbi:hypothetical protein QCA50_017211 [Cerrena zonata]|uniref:Pre-mRNA-splicing factor 18 n=1 Tax=Cerrena zonata TaxID=2478898 RepID=A0AAW0FK41_9APHY